jgi:hypothetical protein
MTAPGRAARVPAERARRILRRLNGRNPRARAWAIGAARGLLTDEELVPVVAGAWAEADITIALMRADADHITDAIFFGRRLFSMPEPMAVLRVLLATIARNPRAKAGRWSPPAFLPARAGDNHPSTGE